MRVTQKGQVTIPLEVRRALGISAGSDVEFQLEGNGARLIVDQAEAAREIRRMRGAGSGELEHRRDSGAHAQVSHRGGTFVDSSVLLDVFTEDPKWADWSEGQLILAAQRGALVLNAVVLAEIAPRFERVELLRASLPSMATIEEVPLAAAFLAGHAHTGYRKAGGRREAILPGLPDRSARRSDGSSPAHAGSSTGGRPHPGRGPDHAGRRGVDRPRDQVPDSIGWKPERILRE